MEFLDFLRVAGRIVRDAATEMVDGRAKVVQLGIVNQDVPVVKTVGVLDREALVLAIELLNLGSRGLAAILADKAHGHVGRLLRKDVQERHIGIRVDDQEFRFRLSDEPRDHADRVVLGVGRKNPAGKKLAAIKGVEHRIESLVGFDQLDLNIAKPLKDARARQERMAHNYKRPHNANVGLDCGRRVKNAAQHSNTTFCKGIGEVFQMPAPALV